MAITWTDISAISWLANGEAATAVVFNRPTTQIADNTDWLRDRLLQEHNSDGTHQSAGLLASLTGAITNLHINATANIVESKLSLALIAKPRPGGGAYSDTGQMADDIYAGIRVDNLYDAAVVTPLDGQVLEYESASSTWKNVSPAAGITDHGLLSGRDDDDHSIYVLTNGTRVITGNQSMGTYRLTNLAAPIDPNDAVRKADLDAAIAGFDWQDSVLTRQNDPPGSPSNDDRYLIGASPTGAWVGHAHQIAEYQTGWQFVGQSEGQAVWVENSDNLWVYNGSAFVQFADLGLVSTLADADGDTRIRCEAAADEDYIRFDCGGTEVAYMVSAGTSVMYLTGRLEIASDVAISETVAGSYHGFITFGISNHWSVGKDVTDDDFVIKQAATFGSGSAIIDSNLRIQDGTGYVGINNDNPLDMLDIHGTTGYSGITSRAPGASYRAYGHGGSDPASPTAVPASNWFGAYRFGGYDGSNWEESARIQTFSTELWSGSARGSKMYFYVTETGTTNSVQVMALGHNGMTLGGTGADVNNILGSGSPWVSDDNKLATTGAIDAYVTSSGVLTYDQGTFGLNVTIVDATDRKTVWKTNNTAPTTIDRVSNAINGQWILIMADDDNTTIESQGAWPPPSSDYIVLQGGVDFSMKRGDMICLVQVDGYIAEFSRSLNG